MSVTLLRAYQGFAAGAIATFDSVTEAALVAQSFATYTATGGVNPTVVPPLTGAITAGTYGPAVISNIPMGAAALTGYESNGVAQTQGNVNLTEIFVPHWNTWTGAAALNGTTVTTSRYVFFLFNSLGYLIANTTTASEGTLTATASVFQKIAFTVPVTLAPGRYFVGVTLTEGGTWGTTASTDTVRHVLTANGAEPRCRNITSPSTTAALNVAAFQAAPITVPTTFTTALAPIVQLYS